MAGTRRHRRRRTKVLGTIWRCPDGWWEQVALVLDELDPPAATGHPRVDQRKALDGMIYQMRTGCQWSAIPEEFGDDSSIHRTMQRWAAKGVFVLVWSLLVAECDDFGGVDFEWQAADGARLGGSGGKARSGGISWARTPRIGARTAPRRA